MGTDAFTYIMVIFQIFGGLALFLFGIRFLSGGLEKFAGVKIQGMLEKQVVLETEAIDMYKKMISTIDDPEVVGVMKHALDEERRHRKEFRDRIKKIDKKPS